MAKLLIISLSFVLLALQRGSVVNALECEFDNSTIPVGNWAVGVPYIQFNITFLCPDNYSIRYSELFDIQWGNRYQNSTLRNIILFDGGYVYIYNDKEFPYYISYNYTVNFNLSTPYAGEGKITFNITHINRRSIDEMQHYTYEMNFIFCPTKLYNGAVTVENVHNFTFNDQANFLCIEGIPYNEENQKYVTDSIIAYCKASAEWQINNEDRFTCKPGHLLDFSDNELTLRVGEIIVFKYNAELYWNNEIYQAKNVTLSSSDHSAVIRCGNLTASRETKLNVTFPPEISGIQGYISLIEYVDSDQNSTTVNFMANPPLLNKNQIRITGEVTWLNEFRLTNFGVSHSIHMKFNKPLSPQETYGIIFNISSPVFAEHLVINVTIRLRQITTKLPLNITNATMQMSTTISPSVLIAIILCPVIVVVIAITSIAIFLKKRKSSPPAVQETDCPVYDEICDTRRGNSYENSPYENVLMGTSGPKDTVKQSTIYDDDENYVTMQGQISNRNSAAVEGNYETVEPHTQSQYEYFQP